MKIQLDVVTPSRKVVSAACDEVYAPGGKGEFGVLPEHAPLVATLSTGVVRYREGAAERKIAVRSGFAHVADNKMILLADEAKVPGDPDLRDIPQKISEIEAKLVSPDVGAEEREPLFAERDWLYACRQLLN